MVKSKLIVTSQMLSHKKIWPLMNVMKTNIRLKLPFNLEKTEQFGKIENNKKCENKKSVQNISSVAPGPTKFFKGKSSQCL